MQDVSKIERTMFKQLDATVHALALDRSIAATDREALLWGLRKLDEFYRLSRLPGERWVRVEDGLPKRGVKVLVAYDKGDFAGWVREGMYLNENGRQWNVFTPTHWRPLPAPPSEPSRESTGCYECDNGEIPEDGMHWNMDGTEDRSSKCTATGGNQPREGSGG